MKNASPIFKFPKPIVTLLTLIAAALVFSYCISYWFLLSPFAIYLGAVCASPNFNLANGFLAWLLSILILPSALLNPHIAMALSGMCLISMYLCGFEYLIRKKPCTPDDLVVLKLKNGPPCPYCGSGLISEQSKQCDSCFMDWHDSEKTYLLKTPLTIRCTGADHGVSRAFL